MARGKMRQRPAQANTPVTYNVLKGPLHANTATSDRVGPHKVGRKPAKLCIANPLTKGTLFYSFPHPPELLACKHKHIVLYMHISAQFND